MAGPAGDPPPILQEVRHRRLGKVVVAYLGLAFAAVEAGAWVVALLDLPEVASRGVLGVAVLGFPVAVVLGWKYDLTPQGVVRTPDQLTEAPENPTTAGWAVLTVLGVVLGVAIRLMRT